MFHDFLTELEMVTLKQLTLAEMEVKLNYYCMENLTNLEINLKVSKVGAGLEQFNDRLVHGGENSNILFLLSGVSQASGSGTRSILCWPRCPAGWAGPPSLR